MPSLLSNQIGQEQTSPAGCFSTYFDFSGKDDAAAQHATDWNIFSFSVAVFCQNSPWSPMIHVLESDGV